MCVCVIYYVKMKLSIFVVNLNSFVFKYIRKNYISYITESAEAPSDGYSLSAHALKACFHLVRLKMLILQSLSLVNVKKSINGRSKTNRRQSTIGYFR